MKKLLLSVFLMSGCYIFNGSKVDGLVTYAQTKSTSAQLTRDAKDGKYDSEREYNAWQNRVDMVNFDLRNSLTKSNDKDIIYAAKKAENIVSYLTPTRTNLFSLLPKLRNEILPSFRQTTGKCDAVINSTEWKLANEALDKSVNRLSVVVIQPQPDEVLVEAFTQARRDFSNMRQVLFTLSQKCEKDTKNK